MNHTQIAFLCHPYHRGGVTRWMADAAIAYAQRGWSVYFITVLPAPSFVSSGGMETMVQLLSSKEGAAINIISAHAGREFELGTAGYRTYVYQRLLLQLEKGTPVILSDDLSVWEAATFLHQLYPIIGVLHADERHYYALAERFYRQVSVFACVSERVSRIAMERVPQIPADTVYTISCGIGLPPVDTRDHSGSILQLVYVGRLSEFQKRVGDLVKVCAVLNARGVAFHMDILGDGVDRHSLEQKVKDAGLSVQMTFHGWQSQAMVGEKLAASDILLLTSDFEGTPIAMMEALAAGCGLVGTRVSGIEDYELHPMAPDCFAVFDAGDISAAADSIEKIAAKPAHARRSAARKLAEAEFTMDICLDRYTHAIEGIKENSGTAPAVNFPLRSLLYSRAVGYARTAKLALTRSK